MWKRVRRCILWERSCQRRVLAGPWSVLWKLSSIVSFPAMLFMVIETYKHGAQSVYARAAERGRMLPPGLVYLDSWVDERRLDRCFQLMETDNPALFDDWISNWVDLVDFGIVPVVNSREAAGRTLK